MSEQAVDYHELDRQLPKSELRAKQARQLAEVLRRSKGLAVDTSYTPPLSPDERFKGKYAGLGEQLYIDFVRRARATTDSELIYRASRGLNEHGCRVLTRLMAEGAPAYTRYLDTEPDHQPAVSELGTIMLRSRGVVKTFADQDKKANTIIETAFGLLGDYQYGDEPPFYIGPNEDGELLFTPSPVIMQHAMLAVMQKRLSEGLPMRRQPGEIYCPAVGIVLDSLWERGLEMCVADDTYFAADLGELLPGRTIGAEAS